MKSNVQGPSTTPVFAILCLPDTVEAPGGQGLLCAFSLSQSQACRRSSKSIMTLNKKMTQIRDPVLVLLLIHWAVHLFSLPLWNSLFLFVQYRDRTRSVVLSCGSNQNESRMLITMDGCLGPTLDQLKQNLWVGH